MLRSPLAWWKKLLECDDSNARRNLIESGAKLRFKTTPPLTAKKEQKVLRDVWDLAWSIAAIERPLEALDQLEAGLGKIAKEAEVELLPRDEELDRFLASGEADTHRAACERRIAEEKLLRWLASSEEDATFGERI